MKLSIEPTYDVILIPGGGVREGGNLPLWVKERLDCANSLQKGEYILTLSAGTTHKPPPIDHYGFPIFESVAAANYLQSKGINPQKILSETSSYDTIGNAYFSRMIHVEPRGFKKLLIITSNFHLIRTESIFRWVYGLNSESRAYELNFLAVDDVGISTQALQERKEKEQLSLTNFFKIKSQIKNLSTLHQWLFTKHSAYAVGIEKNTIKNSSLETY